MQRRLEMVFSGLAAACATGALTYSLSRLVQAAFFPQPDPRTLLFNGRIAFFWRVNLSLFVATMAFLGALALRRQLGKRFDQALPSFALFVVIVATLQGAFVP